MVVSEFAEIHKYTHNEARRAYQAYCVIQNLTSSPTMVDGSEEVVLKALAIRKQEGACTYLQAVQRAMGLDSAHGASAGAARVVARLDLLDERMQGLGQQLTDLGNQFKEVNDRLGKFAEYLKQTAVARGAPRPEDTRESAPGRRPPGSP